MTNFKEAMHIIQSSKEYYFEGSVLVVTGYYNGKQFKLDLGKLDEEMFEALQPDESDEGEW